MQKSATFLRGVTALSPRRRTCGAILIAGLLPTAALAQTAFTWQQIKDKFEAANPTLKSAQLNIDESRAAEITAYLRPNPSFEFASDGTQITPYGADRSPALSF